MLDRDEDAALAEIEAALRRDDPDFVMLLEGLERDPLGFAEVLKTLDETAGSPLPDAPLFSVQPVEFDEDDEHRPARRWWRIASVVLACLVAVALTLAVTVAWGPDAGGLVGVVTVMAATMYGYQVLRGCPGTR